MKLKRIIFLFACLGLLTTFSFSHAAVELDVKKTLKLKDPPLDLAVSKSGKWIFVLTAGGEVAIYSSNGNLEETIQVGAYVTRIKEGPEDNLLLTSDRENKTVQVIALDFIQKISTTGAVRGNADAPVTIALFAEFQ